MARTIGIVCEDSAIGIAIYQRIIEKINGLHNPSKHPDIVIYARDLGLRPGEKVYEGTETMHTLNVPLTVFPDLDTRKLSGTSRSTDIAAPEAGSLITAKDIKEIRENLLSETVPQDERLKRRYVQVSAKVEYWANTLLELAEKGFHADIAILPANHTLPSEKIQKIAHDPSRHNGLIAVHGGMGPEAGNHSLRYLTRHFDGSLLLLSPHVNPKAIDFILDIEHHRYSEHANPFPEVRKMRQLADKLNPDAMFMACNTMHYYHEGLSQDLASRQLNIIEEGLKKLPYGSNPLILATRASTQTEIFQKALHNTGRKDVTLHFPTPSEQTDINDAIETYILPHGAYDKAARLLESVVENHRYSVDCVIAGCTEVIIGLTKGGANLPLPIIDNAQCAADTAIAITLDKLRNSQGFATKIHNTNRQTGSMGIH